jgi:hypothetical protein
MLPVSGARRPTADYKFAYHFLSDDRETRTQRYKGLFGCERKMVPSDSPSHGC